MVIDEEIKQEYIPITKGATLSAPSQQSALLIDPDFVDAKEGDAQAAQRLIDKLFSEEKLAEVKGMIDPTRPTVFISMPGTSRRNQIPAVFAEFLAEKTGQSFIDSDEHVMPLHNKKMRKLGRAERMFNPRLFKPFEDNFFDDLKAQHPNAKFIIVEDVFTTGASVNTFARFLQKNGIPVEGIIGVNGNPDVSPTAKLISKLDEKFKKAGIAVNGKELGQELSRSEVETMITTSYKVPPEILGLMQKQMGFLYDVKVNGNYDASIDLAQVTHTLADLKSAGTAQHQRDTPSVKTTEKVSTTGLLRMLKAGAGRK